VNLIERHGLRWWVREDTSDLKSIDEVVGDRAYFTRYFDVEAGDVWLDAGANIGAFSVYVGSKGAEVTAYEPHPDNAELARRNLRENGVEARVWEKAVALTGGLARLGLASTAYAQWRHSILLTQGDGFAVPVVALADLLPRYDCVKLDIEGSEIAILRSGTDWSAQRKLTFEWHFDHEQRTDVYLDVIANLQEQFPNVRYRKVPPGENYRWFPPAALVRCWR
jgi:FkbM family methyltransferase